MACAVLGIREHCFFCVFPFWGVDSFFLCLDLDNNDNDNSDDDDDDDEDNAPAAAVCFLAKGYAVHGLNHVVGNQS